MCSIEMFIKLALTLFFKTQQHRQLIWLDKDSDKDQSQLDELFN
jgi:Ca2+/H+ antiporter